MGRLQTRDAIQIGQTLQKIKLRIHAAGERNFKALAENDAFGFSYRQAKRYMALARFAKGDILSPSLTELPLTEAYERAGIVRFHSSEETEALSRRAIEIVPVPDKVIAGLPVNQIVCGDALDVLRKLPANSVHCIVSSPPYYMQKDYGVRGQIGLEQTIDEYISKLVLIFSEARRILRDDGTCWVNIGDGYAVPGQTGGLPEKNLFGCPWRLALAMQEDGWILRADIVWHKPNPMPESIQNRPTKAHEFIFLLSKTADYFYDAEAVKEPAKPESEARYRHSFSGPKAGRMASPNGHERMAVAGRRTFTPFRNLRTVWTVPPSRSHGEHCATFPEALIEPIILAGCPANGIVLDPFAGLATSCLVAKRLRRRWIGIELSPKYCKIARGKMS